MTCKWEEEEGKREIFTASSLLLLLLVIHWSVQWLAFLSFFHFVSLFSLIPEVNVRRSFTALTVNARREKMKEKEESDSCDHKVLENKLDSSTKFFRKKVERVVCDHHPPFFEAYSSQFSVHRCVLYLLSYPDNIEASYSGWKERFTPRESSLIFVFGRITIHYSL